MTGDQHLQAEEAGGSVGQPRGTCDRPSQNRTRTRCFAICAVFGPLCMCVRVDLECTEYKLSFNCLHRTLSSVTALAWSASAWLQLSSENALFGT